MPAQPATPTPTPAESKLAHNGLIKARIALLQTNPFFGSLALNMTLIESMDVDTLATDIRGRCKYNPHFVLQTIKARNGDRAMEFILCHEIMHLAEHHFDRCGARNPRVWNSACVKGETIIPGMYKRMDKMQVGDWCYAKSGKRTKVTKTFENEYNGEMVKIKSRLLHPIEVTAEHPVLVVPFKIRTTYTPVSVKLKPGQSRYSIEKAFGEPQWIPASEVSRGHMLVVPKIKGHSNTKKLSIKPYIERIKNPIWKGQLAHRAVLKDYLKLDEEMAWAMGLYVAEGSAVSPSSFCYSLGNHEKDRKIIGRLVNVFAAIGYSPNVHVGKPGNTDENSIKVIICSTILRKAFAEWFGRGAKNKRIPAWLMEHTNTDIVKAFLRGFHAGDGNTFITKAGGGSVQLGTSSKVLALQLQMLLGRLTTLASSFEITQRNRVLKGRVLPRNPFYPVTSRHPDILTLFDAKFTKRHPRTNAYDQGDYWLVRVGSVEKYHYTGKVYNIETKEHNYLVSNAVVHNCDYAINQILVDADFQMPENIGLLDAKYKGLPAEAIYSRLQDEIEKNGGNADIVLPGGSAANGQCGACADGHGDGDKDGQGKGEGNEGVNPHNWPIHIAAAAALAKQYGKLPASLERYVKDRISPKLDWKKILAKLLRVAISSRSGRDDFSYARVSRRAGALENTWGRNTPILAATVAHDPGEVLIAIDTSGSIGGAELQAFASEAIAVVEQVGRPCRVVYCDAQVAAELKVDGADYKKLIKKAKGGGGTSFIPVFEYADEMRPAPCCVVYLTDMYGEFPSVAPKKYQTIWVATSDEKGPFGKTIKLDLNELPKGKK